MSNFCCKSLSILLSCLGVNVRGGTPVKGLQIWTMLQECELVLRIRLRTGYIQGLELQRWLTEILLSQVFRNTAKLALTPWIMDVVGVLDIVDLRSGEKSTSRSPSLVRRDQSDQQMGQLECVTLTSHTVSDSKDGQLAKVSHKLSLALSDIRDAPE